MDPSLERYVAKVYSLLTGYWFIAKVKHPPTLLEFFKEIENVITGEM